MRELLEDMIDVNGEVYVCGPVPFMEKMISELRALGMADDQIHYEFFGPAVALQTG